MLSNSHSLQATEELYISLKIFHSVGPRKAIHHHPHFLSFTNLQFLLPWTNSYTLYPLDGSDCSNSMYPLPPPYHFGMHVYGILPTLKRPAYSSKISVLTSTSATCHRTCYEHMKTNSVITCGHWHYNIQTEHMKCGWFKYNIAHEIRGTKMKAVFWNVTWSSLCHLQFTHIRYQHCY
jgi:hypothetical protein